MWRLGLVRLTISSPHFVQVQITVPLGSVLLSNSPAMACGLSTKKSEITHNEGFSLQAGFTQTLNLENFKMATVTETLTAHPATMIFELVIKGIF